MSEIEPGDPPSNSSLLDCLDAQDFYEVMQAYRHARLLDQKSVTLAFEAVKRFIRENHKWIVGV